MQETKRLEKQSSEAAEVVHHQETTEQEVLLEETQPDSLTNEGKDILDSSSIEDLKDENRRGNQTKTIWKKNQKRGRKSRRSRACNLIRKRKRTVLDR